MSISAIHRGQPRWPSRRSALCRLTPLAGAAGLMILASACAASSPHPASDTGRRPQHATAAAEAASPAAATPAASAASAASPTTGATDPAGAAAAYTGPHFATAQAAMTYLVAAYNSDDTAAMHAVTDPQAFTALQDMRSSDVALRLKSCQPTPRGDDECTFRYTDTAGGQPSGRNAMVLAAPALNPGWYMYRFLEGCD